MDIQRYLRRIGYRGSITPSAETLRDLHKSHMLSVPFENLDIHMGVPIVLDEEKFFDKIVVRRRGGFCYELNGLFAALLRSLGFDVTLLSGRVFSGGKVGPEFDHMTLLVQLEERWIADVGFGDSFLEPLRLDDPYEQEQRGVAYRIEKTGDVLTLMERKPGTEWAASYQFTLQPRTLDEFNPMCHWQQTSPESHFTQKRLCTRATPEGRITLSDMKLIVTRSNEKDEKPLSDETYGQVLETHFGIVME